MALTGTVFPLGELLLQARLLLVWAAGAWWVIGRCQFRVLSDHTQIRGIAAGVLLIADTDGNRYRLEHRERLPAKILKRIEEQI